MRLLKFDEAIIDADKITHVVLLASPATGHGVSRTLGITIYFVGGGELDILNPKAMEAFMAWAAGQGLPIGLVAWGQPPLLQPSIKVFGNTGGGSSGGSSVIDPVTPPARP